jgi:hypothetical protein
VDAAADTPAEPERASGAPVAEASQSISAPYAGRHGVSAKPMLFLSHAGADTEAARALNRRLEEAPAAREQGLKVWFDKDDLRAEERDRGDVGPRCRDTGAAARVFRRVLREPWVPARLMALVISSSDGQRGIRLDTFCRIIQISREFGP